MIGIHQTERNISRIMWCDVCILNPSCNDQTKISLQTSKFPSHAWLSSTVKIDKRWQYQITKTCRESRGNCIRVLKQGRRGWLRERHETVVSTCLSFYSFFGGFAGFVSVFRWFRRFWCFRWFRFDGYVSVFRVLVHAIFLLLCHLKLLGCLLFPQKHRKFAV